ncbi:MAG: transposase [Oligoflexus sp.]|nr:transposase [Oligoflexus sp.]
MTNTKKTKSESLCSDCRKIELSTWVGENAEGLPSVVKDALSHYNLLLDGLAGDQRRLRSTLLQLRRALGILASSEKRKSSGDPIGSTAKPGDQKPKNPKEQLRLSLIRYQELEAWHKALVKKNGKKIKKLKGALMKIEDIEFTEEELSENAKESAEHMNRLTLGEGPQDELESPKQAFMQGGLIRVDEEIVTASVNPELLVDEKIVTRMMDERTRYSFNLTLSKVTVEVEKIVVRDAGSSTRIISASTREIGPPKMDVTWDFLANMTIMVAQYAMPFNRLGTLLTVPDKHFTSAKISRMFGYVAQQFRPIYLHNFRSLSNARLLSGDDTTTRVVEFSRFLKELQLDPETERPWYDFATRETAEATFKQEAKPSLGVLTAKELGFEFDRKDGNGQKKSLQTTVLWGRSEAEDPRSAIVFYRSHIGGFGNLLSICLSNRQAEFKDLIVQSDLATVNLVSDAELAARFEIELAGCTSHARRPFALYENDDPDACAHMLHLFRGLYIYERGLDLVGRNDANVRAVRGVDSRRMWEEIKDFAGSMTEVWSKATKLGGAAHYILRHYKKLTAYLDNPIISISNDFSERILRMEKLIQANALFRNSLEGRFALDINRSILQTGIAAHAPLQDYVTYVLRASPAEVQAHPENFTALAYARKNSQPA